MFQEFCNEPELRSNAEQIVSKQISFRENAGWNYCADFFVPSVFQVLDQPDMSIWRRLEKVAVAAGQTLLTVSAAALDPRTLDEAEES